MLIGASKDEPDVAALIDTIRDNNGDDDNEEEDNQEGMGNVDLTENVAEADDSDEEEKKE